MPYFINTGELSWGPKVAYIWGASNFTVGGKFFPQIMSIGRRLYGEFMDLEADMTTPLVLFLLLLPDMKNTTPEESEELSESRGVDWGKD